LTTGAPIISADGSPAGGAKLAALAAAFVISFLLKITPHPLAAICKK
jgi:hypothetical protein